MSRRAGNLAALGVALLAIVELASCSSTRADARGVSRADAHVTTTEAEPGCDTVIVYLDASAPPDQVDAVGDGIESLPGVAAVHHLDRDDSYEEFKRVFADDPEIVQSMAPDQLPTSFRVEVRGADPTSTSTAIEELSLPGIYKVDVPYGC